MFAPSKGIKPQKISMRSDIREVYVQKVQFKSKKTANLQTCYTRCFHSIKFYYAMVDFIEFSRSNIHFNTNEETDSDDQDETKKESAVKHRLCFIVSKMKFLVAMTIEATGQLTKTSLLLFS